MFISLQRHWKIQNVFIKHNKVKVFVLILGGSGCCYEWIAYPRVPKISVSDWVLKLQLLCFPCETPFPLFLTHLFFHWVVYLKMVGKQKVSSHEPWGLISAKKECLPSLLRRDSWRRLRYRMNFLPWWVAAMWTVEFTMSCCNVNCFASLSLSMLC